MSYKFMFMGVEFDTEFDCPFPGGFTATAVDLRQVAWETEEDFDARVELTNQLAQVAWLYVQQSRYSDKWNALRTYLKRVSYHTRVGWEDHGNYVEVMCVKNRACHKHTVVVAKNMITDAKWRDSFYMCDECGCMHLIPPDGHVPHYRAHDVCPDCVERMGLIPCPECGKLYKKDEELLVWRMENGEWVSYETCGRCGYVQGDHVFYCDIHHRYECGHERYYSGFGYGCDYGEDQLVKTTCSMCGRETWGLVEGTTRNVMLFGRKFTGLCENCASRMRQTARIAEEDCRFSYGFKPMTVFFDDEGQPSFEDDGSLHMGFELELDGASDGEDADYFASAVHGEFGGFIYCKSDCSLDDGAESVSQPATPKYLIDSFNWSGLMCAADEYCLDNSSENCGFHVHLNRKFFEQGDGEDMNIAKLTILFDRFYNKFLSIGQREKDRANEWARPSYSYMDASDFTASEHYKYKLESNKSTRYHAINTTNNNTVEVRLFSASTSVVRLKFMLDVLQAVAHAVIELPVMDCLTMDEDNLNAQIINHSIYEQTSRLL